MEDRITYITDPKTIVTFVLFVFSLGATWSSLNGRIRTLEKKVEEFNVIEIKTALKEIQKDIERIKSEMRK